MSSDSDTSELRGETPKTILAVLDAVSITRRKSRFQLVNEILAEWAEQAQAEAIAIERCLRKAER